MTARIVVIREDASPLDGIDDPGGGAFVCRVVDRRTFLRSCSDDDADVIALVATGDGEHARERLGWLRSQTHTIPTIAVLSTNPTLDVLQAAAESVDDFVLSPIRAAEWHQRIQRLLGSRLSGDAALSARDRLMRQMALAKLIGRAPSFMQVVSRIPAVARSGSPVLITGETGTGKELCARAVHHLGPRAKQPFIPVDCGALPEHLFENEVFGHAKGAFTDARFDQRGLVTMADGGTLFLDEVDALALPAQAKLLRFLQERTFKPLGSDRFLRADVNVLSATNRDLDALVRANRFRADLFFRLNVLSLHLVPLRARRGDIPLLARHFVNTICAEQNTPRKTLSSRAIQLLSLYDWPGNVRELHNVVHRAVVSAEGTMILEEHVTPRLRADAPIERPHASFRQARAHVVETFERAFVEELLRRHDGNVTRAAREAQKDRRAFGRLVKKYGLAGR